MQRQGSLALAIVDARLHEAGVDLAAEVPRVHLVFQWMHCVLIKKVWNYLLR
jgi:hypothetical protein